MIEDTTPPEAGDWIPAGLPWRGYPLGTMARDPAGAKWTKTGEGWKADGGDTFTVPGADASEVRLPGASATPIARPAPARAGVVDPAFFTRRDVERLSALAADVETYDPAFLDNLADRIHAFLNSIEVATRADTSIGTSPLDVAR